MLNQNVLNKLKNFFATKNDFRKPVRKDYLKKFSKKKDIAGIVDDLIEPLIPYSKRFDYIVGKIRDQRTAIGNYEERIEKLERKIYITTS